MVNDANLGKSLMNIWMVPLAKRIINLFGRANTECRTKRWKKSLNKR